jgi:ATP-dependent Clp protease ATP-binding subunit ClpB
VDYLASKGFDPVFGARPVKRVIQRELETTLARALLKGEFQVREEGGREGGGGGGRKGGMESWS